MGGKAFGLDMHLDRFLRSAANARIKHSFSKEWLRQVILLTIAATGRRENVFGRFFLTSGRGDFNIVPASTTTSARFYACVNEYNYEMREEGLHEVFVRVSEVPHKPKLYAETKTTNYILNALMTLHANDLGANFGIGVDERGLLTESSIANVAIVKDGALKTPVLEGILAGTSIKRAYALKDKFFASKLLRDFQFCDLTEEDALAADEVMLFGGGLCYPVSILESEAIGDGKPGPIYKGIHRILREDMLHGDQSDDIPYDDWASC